MSGGGLHQDKLRIPRNCMDTQSQVTKPRHSQAGQQGMSHQDTVMELEESMDNDIHFYLMKKKIMKHIAKGEKVHVAAELGFSAFTQMRNPLLKEFQL